MGGGFTINSGIIRIPTGNYNFMPFNSTKLRWMDTFLENQTAKAHSRR